VLLQAWSAGGRPVWSHFPHRSVTFGAARFEPPWQIRDLLPVTIDGRRQVLVALAHHTWWPSLVVAIDASGRDRVVFSNPGHLYALAPIGGGTGHPDIVAALGSNNEHSSGAVAFLDPAVGAKAPTTSPRFTCIDCPAGQPLRYVVLPRTEVSRAIESAPPMANRLETEASGFQVSVLESSTPRLRSLYRFSASFDAESFAVSDAYAEMHARLAGLGRLPHSAGVCPELADGKRIRVWTRGGQWQEPSVPVRRLAATAIDGPD
jgi:hypothetical protein